jgi:para-aminobenzoate synthetase component 1
MALVSNSPELFLSISADGEVETRPIKGTIARGRGAQDDAANARTLSASAKDRAENLMIVDLMRNDLARICAPGSVRVPSMFAVESYANVHHLVSTVTGRLRPGETALSQARAAFPPGSVTGAPKPRALEIIAELEGEARGPYCGAFGVLDGSLNGSGAAIFNVLIRSIAFVREGGTWRARFRSGGGVVADSDPASEYAETLAKAASILKALGAEASR